MTLDERILVRKLAVEKLRTLPDDEGIKIAMGILVDLAKEAGLEADRFTAWAYVSFAHCDGTQEDAIGAMRKAMSAVRAARARSGQR